jgi:hypothetical protein
MDYVNHWNSLYSSKKLEEVSWYQKIPQTSLDFIFDANLSKDDAIIDIGGGDSFLVDTLINAGFTNLTVLDISKLAIDRAKVRLGNNAKKVKWIVCDVRNFTSKKKYVLWHDRAVFHFMKNSRDIKEYYSALLSRIVESSTVVLGTFSENGPDRCCALDVCKYSINDLSLLFSKDFSLIKGENTLHKTPIGLTQAFTFVSLIKN